MLWLILSLFAALGWSIASFFDNYATDVVFRAKTPQAMKILNGIVYLVLAAIMFFVAPPEQIELWQAALLLLSGVVTSSASIFYYQGLKTEEATSATIYYQLIPVLYLIIGWIFFNETISLQQFLGFFIILSAPIIVIFSRKRPKSRRKEVAAGLFFLIYTIMAGASGLLSTEVGKDMNYQTVFFYFILGRGMMDILLYLCNKSWRQRILYIMRRKKKQFLAATLSGTLISLAGEFAYRQSLILGVTALASVVANASQLVITFILGIVLSLIWPKFGREKLKRHVIVAHLIAVVLCVVGVIILQ